MANTWFQFKQFTVHQEKAAMKVTTDACLFGAMLKRFQSEGEGVRFLDVGTGTGLLSLMSAQMNPAASIIGVEIDEETAKEAAQNVANSPFQGQITILHRDVSDYNPQFKFDYIFSNPPFHEAQLTSPNEKKNIAHHEGGLSLNKLVPLLKKLLMTPFGSASLLVPYYREEELIYLCNTEKLFPSFIARVKQSPKHSYLRSMVHIGQKKMAALHTEITIRDEKNHYTPEFMGLLRPYYLNL
jgi:tRNA1Val (adenine37-N6)-methyltransferase